MKKEKEWKEEFEKISHYKNDHRMVVTSRRSLQETKIIFSELLRYFFIPKNKALDIGCGSGIFVEILAKEGFKKIVGVDFSPSFINKARKRFDNKKVDYKIGEITKLDFAENEFDLVVCLGVFQNFNDSKDQQKVLNKIRRVLKKDGYLIMSTLNKFSLGALFSDFFSIFKKNKSSIKIVRYNPFILANDLKQKGFEIKEFRGMYASLLSGLFVKLLYKTKLINLFNKFFILTNFMSHSFLIIACLKDKK